MPGNEPRAGVVQCSRSTVQWKRASTVPGKRSRQRCVDTRAARLRRRVPLRLVRRVGGGRAADQDCGDHSAAGGTNECDDHAAAEEAAVPGDDHAAADESAVLGDDDDDTAAVV